MTSVSKNVYIDKLDDIVNKHSNKNHSTIKMKLVDVKSSTYIDSSKEIYKVNLKTKMLCRGHILLVVLTEKKLLEQNCKKRIRKNLELKK